MVGFSGEEKVGSGRHESSEQQQRAPVAGKSGLEPEFWRLPVVGPWERHTTSLSLSFLRIHCDKNNLPEQGFSKSGLEAAASAPPGNLLEAQTLYQKLWRGEGEAPSNLCFNKTSRRFCCTL